MGSKDNEAFSVDNEDGLGSPSGLNSSKGYSVDVQTSGGTGHKGKDVESSESVDGAVEVAVDTTCGYFSCKPEGMQKHNTTTNLIACLCFFAVIEGEIVNFFFRSQSELSVNVCVSKDNFQHRRKIWNSYFQNSFIHLFLHGGPELEEKMDFLVPKPIFFLHGGSEFYLFSFFFVVRGGVGGYFGVGYRNKLKSNFGLKSKLLRLVT